MPHLTDNELTKIGIKIRWENTYLCAGWNHLYILCDMGDGFFSFLFLQLISVSHLFFLLKITLRSLFHLPSFSSPPFVTFKLLASFGGGNERDLRWMIPNACQSIFPKFLIFMQFWAYILPNNWLAHSVWSLALPSGKSSIRHRWHVKDILKTVSNFMNILL